MFKIKRNNLILLFIILFVLYTFFTFIRPYEDDESQYIRAGTAILNGKLNPFKVVYYKHYSNPFQYIMGSPLVPLIWGISYKVGGVIFVRVLATLFVVLSILLVYNLIIKLGGDPIIPLILIGFSSSTIALASDGLLDSVALFFFISALYLIYTKKMVYAGLLSGLAMTSKFVLVIPIVIIFIYQFFKKKGFQYLIGILVVVVPFLVLYKELIPILVNFVLITKVEGYSIDKLITFLRIFFLALPITSIIVLSLIKSKKIRDYHIFLIPVISIILFQIFLLDYNSLTRHLPYAEFSAAILLGLILKDKKIKYLWLLLILYLVVSISVAIKEVNDYPSYNLIEDNLDVVNGKILALNLNSFMLIKNMPINSTAENVFSYYYFNYDVTTDSKIEEYEQALKDGYFDYATISSYSPNKFSRYKMIEELVRKYYCPMLKSDKSNGIDIYKRCD
ncbi:MAG: hypothetical protein ABIH63_00865 [archaeon]